MTLAHAPTSERAASVGERLHRFTVDEYHALKKEGILTGEDPVELLRGYITIKLDYGPPYDVPLGIPPQYLVEGDFSDMPMRRFTVREYHRMNEKRILHPGLRTELIEGWVVEKMTRGAKHGSTIQRILDAIWTRLTPKWKPRVQSAIAMDDGEPEPDITVVPGPVGRYDHEHPRPHEAALVIEIASSTLAYDEEEKLRMYARNSIRRYWILNLGERQLEVYENPSGPTGAPAYATRTICRSGQTVPLILRDDLLGDLSVNELLPSE